MQQSSVVKKLIMANVIVFFLQLISRGSLSHIFGFVPAYFMGRFWIWQAVTYMFLHGGLFHILFNMFALWLFGSDIERKWGEKEFLKYYFLTGVGAGILTYLSSTHSTIPTVGASGAIFGLLVAYGLMFPNRIILVSLIFPMKAKYVALLLGAIEFMACMRGAQDGIGHPAHLGGMLIGLFYLKYWPRISFKYVNERQEERHKKEEMLFDDKVDAILDKINREGIESLTEREKSILNRYREKLK